MAAESAEHPLGLGRGGLTGVRTTADLAILLRWLRRREARRRAGPELTYRQLATRAGWSHAVVADYFTGKILPPIDRFDALVRLLGASPAEQGTLATIRDHVEDSRRRTAGARPPAADLRADGPADRPADGNPDRFADGQLYVDLRGLRPGGMAVSRSGVVFGFLAALRVPPESLPADLDARARLCRGLLAGRRVLVVLDDARDAAQVRPLLPGSATCQVLVTVPLPR
jgi:transcriptional regulator with XRE-family HTH domain